MSAQLPSSPEQKTDVRFEIIFEVDCNCPDLKSWKSLRVFDGVSNIYLGFLVVHVNDASWFRSVLEKSDHICFFMETI